MVGHVKIFLGTEIGLGSYRFLMETNPLFDLGDAEDSHVVDKKLFFRDGIYVFPACMSTNKSAHDVIDTVHWWKR